MFSGLKRIGDMQDVMERYGLIIAGEKVATSDYFEVRDPGNGERVGECPIATREDLNRAVAAAREAYKSWSNSSDDERKDAEAVSYEGVTIERADSKEK